MDKIEDWDLINEAALKANNEYGQWMPERWLQRFVHHYNAGVESRQSSVIATPGEGDA